MSLNSASCECLRLRRILEEIQGEEQKKATTMFCDLSAIFITKNPITQRKSKHIDLRFHFIRNQVEKSLSEVEHCPTESQLADILTKPLPRLQFVELRSKLGVGNRLAQGRDVGVSRNYQPTSLIDSSNLPVNCQQQLPK